MDDYKEIEIWRYIADHFRNQCYGQGQIEALESNIWEVNQAFGRLVEILAEKEVLTAIDIKQLLCTSNKIKFIF